MRLAMMKITNVDLLIVRKRERDNNEIPSIIIMAMMVMRWREEFLVLWLLTISKDWLTEGSVMSRMIGGDMKVEERGDQIYILLDRNQRRNQISLH